MGNAKTPTGDSTGKLTREEAMKLIEKTTPAKLTAVNEVELPQAVLVDLMAVEVAKADERTRLPGKESPDSVEPIVAGRKGENGAEIVYENGQKVVPPTRKPNKSLQAAQERVDIEQSADEKLVNGGSTDGR